MLLARPRNHVIEPAGFHVFFELFVPECVEVLVELFRQFPSVVRWQLADRVADLGDRAHDAGVTSNSEMKPEVPPSQRLERGKEG
jgi:hypothetical protein